MLVFNGYTHHKSKCLGLYDLTCAKRAHKISNVDHRPTTMKSEMNETI